MSECAFASSSSLIVAAAAAALMMHVFYELILPMTQYVCVCRKRSTQVHNKLLHNNRVLSLRRSLPVCEFGHRNNQATASGSLSLSNTLALPMMLDPFREISPFSFAQQSLSCPMTPKAMSASEKNQSDTAASLFVCSLTKITMT